MGLERDGAFVALIPLGYDGDMVSVWVETLHALLQPRRLLPVGLIAGALLAAQTHLGGDWSSFLAGVVLVVATWLLAPWAWRALFRPELSASQWVSRLLAYAALGLLVVPGGGWVLSRGLGLGPTYLTGPVNVVVTVSLFWVGGWGLGRDISLEANLVRERRRAAGLAREAERAQLLALRTHLDPHFLFNTLNAIAEWCRQDGEVAERAVLQLASMLRTMLEGVRAPSWPLAKELELIQTLFALHRLRDPDRFQMEWQLPAAVPDAELPPLLVLPLAENAIKHGPAAGHRGVIRLSVVSNLPDGRVRIELENPGAYRGPRSGSDGLPTFERRLALAYGASASFLIAAEETSTRAVLDLPQRPVTPEALS